MSSNNMPRKDTLRRYFPNCGLTDDQLNEIANWVKEYLGQQHISPGNKILKAIITWEDAGKSTKEILEDKELMSQIADAKKVNVKKYTG